MNVDKRHRECAAVVRELTGHTHVRLVECEPPFSEEDKLEPSAFWLRPHHRDVDVRRRLLRKQTLSSLIAVLNQVVKFRPNVIIGTGQGGLMCMFCTRSLLLEAACLRMLTGVEMRGIREAWSGVVSLVAWDPLLLPQRSALNEVLLALPETVHAQPWGQHRMMLIGGKAPYPHSSFAESLAGELGIWPIKAAQEPGLLAREAADAGVFGGRPRGLGVVRGLR